MKTTSIFPEEHFILFRRAVCGNRCLGLGLMRETCGAGWFCIVHATPEDAQSEGRESIRKSDHTQ
jgi:hypothetical protein